MRSRVETLADRNGCPGCDQQMAPVPPVMFTLSCLYKIWEWSCDCEQQLELSTVFVHLTLWIPGQVTHSVPAVVVACLLLFGKGISLFIVFLARPFGLQGNLQSEQSCFNVPVQQEFGWTRSRQRGRRGSIYHLSKEVLILSQYTLSYLNGCPCMSIIVGVMWTLLHVEKVILPTELRHVCKS